MQIVPVLFIAMMIEARYTLGKAVDSADFVASRGLRLVTATNFGIATVSLVVTFVVALGALSGGTPPEGPLMYIASWALGTGLGAGIVVPAITLYWTATADFWTEHHRRRWYSLNRRLMRRNARLNAELDDAIRRSRGQRIAVKMQAAQALFAASVFDRAARTLSAADQRIAAPRIARIYEFADEVYASAAELPRWNDPDPRTPKDYDEIWRRELAELRQALLAETRRPTA